MRLIDADALRDEVLYDNTYDNDTVNYYLGLIDDTPTVDAAPLTPPQALTLDELKEMAECHRPVYAQSELKPQEGHWCILGFTYQYGGDRVLVAIYGLNLTLGVSDYGKTWLAYPTEPGREATDG